MDLLFKKLHTCFHFVEEVTRFSLSGSTVACHFDVQEGLRPCNFDKHQIGQVIDNIVINAQQAMPAGGTIELSARNVTLGEKEHLNLAKGQYVKISIKDCGVGMPRELLPRIFDPFFTTKAKGHGLGLATCYSIINRHNGYIEVESEQGKGSTFHVYLPAASKSPSDAITPQRVRHRGSGTIIVMDDEEVIRTTIRKMLESLGYSVICKNDGREVVEFFINESNHDHQFAAVILDLTVPGGVGGIAAVKEIRKLDGDVPVFVVSGYADDLVISNPTQYGFTASICKPFTLEEFSKLLDKYLMN